MGLFAPWHGESSQTRAWTRVPCIGRRILNHCATREALSLIFVNLITMCLGMILFGFILPGTLCTSWTWVTVSFPMLGKFSAITSSRIFSGPFSLSSPSGTPIMQCCPRYLLDCLHFFSFFFLYSVPWQWFPPFCLPGQLFVLMPWLFCYCFLLVYFSFQLLYCSSLFVCLFFSSSRSLLNISYVFSILASILFLRSLGSSSQSLF